MGYLLCNNVVYDYSSSLEQGTPYKTQCTTAFLELVYGRHCAIVPVFLVLCVLFTTFSLALILHYPDPPRDGPAFIGLSPLSLSASAVWWDLRTKSA